MVGIEQFIYVELESKSLKFHRSRSEEGKGEGEEDLNLKKIWRSWRRKLDLKKNLKKTRSEKEEFEFEEDGLEEERELEECKKDSCSTCIFYSTSAYHHLQIESKRLKFYIKLKF